MSELARSLIAAAPERLHDLILPGTRDERWRYSSLRSLQQRRFAPSASAETQPSEAVLARINSLAPRLVFVDGRHAPQWSDLCDFGKAISIQANAPATLPPANWPFARAAVAAVPTLALQVSASCATPIHLISITTHAANDALVQQAWRIMVAAGIDAAFVHHRIGPDEGKAFVNLWRDLELADQSNVQWLETASEGERNSVVVGTRATLGASARLELAEVATGAALYRHELDATLVGEQASLIVRGCTMATQRRHADLHFDVRHRAQNTRADILWRGLADQRGHAAFAGQLIVEPGADGADTLLDNKNLLLSPHAEIDTRPILEIYADDVKAAHGATIGRLDERALFYLRSRGIAAIDARRVLQLAFAREPLLKLAHEGLREQALEALAQCLPEDAP